MAVDLVADTAPHGSAAGYSDGCRTAAMCPHHGSSLFLTCVEAIQRRRGDFGAAKLPIDQPIPRRLAHVRRERSSQAERQASAEPVHGTVYGYRRGCHDRQGCPHWRVGKVTCVDARRAYYAAYHSARREGSGTPLTHGTSSGYLAGCRSDSSCPGDRNGTTCSEARRLYRRDRARSAGIGPPPTSVDAAPAAAAIARLTASGWSLRRIARDAGVGKGTVSDIAAGQRLLILEKTALRLQSLADQVASTG